MKILHSIWGVSTCRGRLIIGHSGPLGCGCEGAFLLMLHECDRTAQLNFNLNRIKYSYDLAYWYLHQIPVGSTVLYYYNQLVVDCVPLLVVDGMMLVVQVLKVRYSTYRYLLFVLPLI